MTCTGVAEPSTMRGTVVALFPITVLPSPALVSKPPGDVAIPAHAGEPCRDVRRRETTVWKSRKGQDLLSDTAELANSITVRKGVAPAQ